MERFDALVIGAGDAGLEVASRVATAGGRVAVVYQDPYLGTCLNTGCNPSKFLIERSRILHEARRGSPLGITFGEPAVDFPAIIREKKRFIREARESALDAATESERLALFKGRASFTGERIVTVNGDELTADRVFIATGARPTIPSIRGIDHPRVLTNETLMDQEELPRRLLIIGGGYIASELGQAYRRFGSRVTIVQRATRLCEREEPQISSVLEEAFADEGIEVLLEHEVESIEEHPDGLRLQVRSAGDDLRELTGSHVLVAAGRTPNTDMLRLEATGIEPGDGGQIPVDETLQTRCPGVWAIGDVNGQQPFTRIAQLEGALAYRNAFREAGSAIKRDALPHAVFTGPEIGSVGMTEHEAEQSRHDFEAAAFPVSQVARARLAARPAGTIKLVVERGTGQLLGCHVAAHDGAELIYDAALVMRLGGTVDDLGHAIGTFPTMQEGIEGASRAVAHSLHQTH